MSDSTTELLIFAPAFERLAKPLDERITPLIMEPDGQLHYRDGSSPTAQPSPSIAWANRDLYKDGPVRDFMVTCLKSSRLNWFQSSAAGFEHPIFNKLAGNGVHLTNSNASSVPIAEFVFAQVLSVFHPTQERLTAQRTKAWESFEFRDVDGSTWFIYGMGHVGAAVARRAQAFGAHVIGHRRTTSERDPADEMVDAQGVLSAVARADVVVMAAALNAANAGIVDETFVNALKPDSVLVNIGRGGLVNEPALLAGLDAGHPSVAILDVFEEEPLPEASPFWSHPRVRATAHCAGASAGTGWRGDELFLRNLAHYLDGEPLEFEVDFGALQASQLPTAV
jgi:phosphoglycerate dehydrogenase-like enzyme